MHDIQDVTKMKCIPFFGVPNEGLLERIVSTEIRAMQPPFMEDSK